MKEITILSGKGGTGKTSITAALASIAKNTVFCDNDVDAADLHLILHPEIKEKHIYEGAWVAEINEEQCNNCGICFTHCRFDAIHDINSQYTINPLQCEGCRLCERVCPSNAIISERSLNNTWYVSDTRFGKMVHATMGPGEENSGKLVSEIRRKAREIASKTNADFILNDGPPGIGCTAISSITGTNSVLLVIEPTLSGLHDIKRLIELVRTFKIPMNAIINKSDINTEVTKKIEEYLKNNVIRLLAKIPFNETFVDAMIKGQSIIEYAPDSEISQALKYIWSEISKEENEKTFHLVTNE